MKRQFVILFFILFYFSVFSQQPIPLNMSDSSQLKGDHSKNIHSSRVSKNSNSLNANDSSSYKLKIKQKISTAYKKLDTHKYAKQLDNLKGKAVNKYKKIDSMAHADTGKIATVIAIQQFITTSLKSKRELRDSINAYNLTVQSTKNKREDSLSSIRSLPDSKTAEKQSQQEKTAVEYVNTGSSYLRLNKINDAIFYYEKGLDAAQEIHSLDIIQLASKGLFDAYAKKSDVKKALLYYKQYTEARDSLIKLKSDQAIGELKSKYESEKKQREIQSLMLDAQNKQLELKKNQGQISEQKQFIVLIGIALFLTMILTVTLFRQYRTKKQNNETLLIQNNKIAVQKKEIEESLIYTQQLQEVLKEDLDHYMQAALRKQMNPHFIFNSLNSIQSFILQNDKLSANIYLSKFAGLMRKVLENSQYRLISIEKEIEVLKLYIELEEQRFDNKFNCIWNIAENIDLIREKIPPLILQPYIENAIWHGLLHKEGNKTLSIEIQKKENKLICSVQDNGIGRTAAMEIRKNISNHKSLGTKITQKRIDLINSLNKSEINMQYYDLYDDKGIACGTKAELVIPASEIILMDNE